MKTYVTIFFMLLVLCVPVVAQEVTEEPTDALMTEQAWLVTDLDADAADDTEASTVIFLSLDDGATLIEVARGDDLVYTRGEEGLYTGALLIPTDVYDFEATLEITDGDTRQVTAATQSGSFTYESNLLYERSDLEFGVWVEGERDLIEYSMFAECLGRVDVEPPAAWANPDPILPIRIDDEAGELTIGNTVLIGGDGLYELVEESEFGQFTQVITQTAVVSEELITFSLNAIAGERDDCELRYETVFMPFDGDYEALFTRAAELSEDE